MVKEREAFFTIIFLLSSSSSFQFCSVFSLCLWSKYTSVNHHRSLTIYLIQMCSQIGQAKKGLPFKEPIELPLPDLIGESEILNEDRRRQVCKFIFLFLIITGFVVCVCVCVCHRIFSLSISAGHTSFSCAYYWSSSFLLFFRFYYFSWHFICLLELKDTHGH